MNHDIPLIPDVPDALREAAQLGTLVPFVGAGASKLAGCPDWDEFANAALRLFVDLGAFSHAQLDQVKHLRPRIKLSLALALQAASTAPIDFGALLHRQARTEHATGRRLYSHLSRLGKTFVTTNYDEWLDDEFPAPALDVSGDSPASADAVPKPRQVYYKTEDLTAAHLNEENAVIHLHGSVKHPEGMVLTTQQYVQHYANDRRRTEADAENIVLTFLEHLFRYKTVLFIGYGLDELEILEYIIVKKRMPATPGLQPRHFLLQGFYSHERELMVSMRTYYRECGVELLPFLKDQRGWDQLIDVLETFGRLVPASSPLLLQEFKDMEALLNG
jgi:hypothetical protein